MALREVTVEYDVNDAEAGTLFEIWVKEGAGAWHLRQTGAAAHLAATQSFRIIELPASTAIKVQARMSIGGRYRDDYAPLNPDSWPADSLIEFTTSAP